MTILTTMVILATAHADTPKALLTRAETALEAWDIEGAAKIASELEDNFPDDVATRYVEGRVLFEQGAYGRAADLLEQAQADEDAHLARAAEKAIKDDLRDESAHFVLFTRAKDHFLAPYALDTLEHQYAALAADFHYAPPDAKIRVEIYDSPKTLASISTLTESEIKASGTIALCKYNRLMATSPRALVRGYPWLDTMAHELTHFFITKRTRNAVPIWVHEGLAKHLETRWRGAGGQSMEPGLEELLANGVRDNNLVTFERMSPSIAKLPSQEEAALAFAEVETAVEYLRKVGGAGALPKLLAAFSEGATDKAAVAAGAGEPYEKFVAGWKAAIAHRPSVSGLSFEAARIKMKFRDDSSAKAEAERYGYADVKDPAARKLAHLGELYLTRHRITAAADAYGRAHKQVGDRSVTLSRRYGLSLLLLSNFAEAERVLAGSVTLYPNEAPAHLLLARIYTEKKQWDGCVEQTEWANRVDPFDPELHARWAECAKNAGRSELATREAQAAAALTSK